MKTSAEEILAVPAPRRTRHEVPTLVLYAISAASAIAIWLLVSHVDSSTSLLPTPRAVVESGRHAVADGTLFENVWASLKRVLLGFCLGVAVAVPLGFVMGWYRWGRYVVEPYVQFLRTIPPLALIPIVIIFLGIGESAKVFLIFLASLLSCVIPVFQGVRNVDKVLIDAAHVLGANDSTLFSRVVVPASMPYIFTGMRVALGSAWATLVAAELIAAQRGLGQLMQNAAAYFDVPTIIVGIIAIGVLGFAMDRILLLLERRVTRWQPRRSE